MELHGSSPRGEDKLATGVIGILVLGVFLGLAYNYSGLRGNPAFGIAWIGEERVLPSLELEIESPATGSEAAASTGAPEIPDSEEPRQIQTAGVKRFFDSGAALLVDAREAAEYEAGHIAGAVNLPYAEATPDEIDALAPESRPIITYCDGGACELSMGLAWDIVMQTANRKVLVFMGGFPEWEAAGYPVERGAGTALSEALVPKASPRTDLDDPMGFFGASTAAADLPAIPEMDRPMSMELATVKQFYDAGQALLIDAREIDEFAEGHIPGAVNLPYEEIQSDPGKLLLLEPGDRPIIAYCGGGSCEVSITVADALIAAGYRRVLVYTGGFPEWQAAGYPVARGAGAAQGG